MDTELENLGGYRLVLTDREDSATREFIHERIKAFNDGASPYHRAVRSEGLRPLDIYVHDETGALRGGLVGDTYWGWLEIRYLWLEDGLRRDGLGTQLVHAAEEEARRRGCQHAWLSTYSFQARPFYERLGYRVIGQLDDYPPGMTYFWLRKDWPPAEASAPVAASEELQ